MLKKRIRIASSYSSDINMKKIMNNIGEIPENFQRHLSNLFQGKKYFVLWFDEEDKNEEVFCDFSNMSINDLIFMAYFASKIVDSEFSKTLSYEEE